MYETSLTEDISLSEIYQTIGMRFAFARLTKEGNTQIIRQIHPFVKCKDFMGDAMWATKFKKNYTRYRFTFDGTKEKVQFDKTLVLIEYNDFKTLQNHMKVIHHFEASARWRWSELVDLKKKTTKGVPVYLMKGSAMWVRSPAMLSLYTMLIRLAGVGIKNDELITDFITRCSKLETNDGVYIKFILDTGKELGFENNPLYTVMRKSRKIFEDTYKNGANSSTFTVHYQNGIKALFQNAKNFKTGKLAMNEFASHWAKNLISVLPKK